VTQESGRFSKPFWSACSLARCGSSQAGAPGTCAPRLHSGPPGRIGRDPGDLAQAEALQKEGHAPYPQGRPCGECADGGRAGAHGPGGAQEAIDLCHGGADPWRMWRMICMDSSRGAHGPKSGSIRYVRITCKSCGSFSHLAWMGTNSFLANNPFHYTMK